MNKVMKKEPDPDKLRVALYTRGVGVVLFAVWSFLRVFLVNYIGNESSAAAYALQYSATAAFIADFIIAAIEIQCRIYVGHCAVSFSRGGKLHRFSLYLAGFFAGAPLLVSTIYLAILGLSSVTTAGIFGIAVDLIVAVLNVQIIVYSLRLKKAGA